MIAARTGAAVALKRCVNYPAPRTATQKERGYRPRSNGPKRELAPLRWHTKTRAPPAPSSGKEHPPPRLHAAAAAERAICKWRPLWLGPASSHCDFAERR
ncbi:hypothetical protein MRX96_011441 [Rhipicephalus microplus]